jgi:hypothetical protein
LEYSKVEKSMTTETRDLPEFSSVSMEGHADLTLVHGSAPSIIIETDPETLEHLKVEVENGRLVLSMKSWLDHLFHSWKKVTYTVTFTTLNAVSVSGSGKVQAAAVDRQGSGASHLRLGQCRPGRHSSARSDAHQRQR